MTEADKLAWSTNIPISLFCSLLFTDKGYRSCLLNIDHLWLCAASFVVGMTGYFESAKQ